MAEATAPLGHLVLVHGAWQGGWAFDAWRPHLTAAGWRVHSPELPGNGWGPLADAPASLAAYCQHLLGLLQTLDGPVVLVGHSGGGISISQVAEVAPDRLSGLVYLAGMMLPSGLGFGGLLQQCLAALPATGAEAEHQRLAGIGPHLEWNSNRSASRVPEAAARALFLHDCPDEAAARAASLLRWQPEGGRAMVNQLSAERFGRLPRLYVECLQDRSVTLPLQRRMQALSPGAEVLTLDCGHVPQLACPAALTEALLPRLRRWLG